MAAARSAIREPFNAISHLIGAILAALGGIALLILAQGNPAKTAAAAIYLTGAAAMFGASAAYHWARENAWLQRFDHAAIYVMIAGSYTPVALLALPGVSQTAVLIAQWSLAVIGVVCSLVMRKTSVWIRVPLYLLMGWMVLPIIGQILPALGVSGVGWMILGGIMYSVGVVFYARKRPGMHEIWHLFVLAGAICHFVAIFGLVLRTP